MEISSTTPSILTMTMTRFSIGLTLMTIMTAFGITSKWIQTTTLMMILAKTMAISSQAATVSTTMMMEMTQMQTATVSTKPFGIVES